MSPSAARPSASPGTAPRRRVALVCMPFHSPTRPSLAIGTLAQGLRQLGHTVDEHYFNLDALRALGLRRYLRVSSLQDSQLRLLGEWLFSHPAITPGAADWRRFRSFLRSHPHRQGSLPFQRMPLPAIRRRLSRLLAAWLGGQDWAAYDVVGFSVLAHQLNASLRLARSIKERWPAVRVVLGGAALLPRVGAALLGRYPWLDAVFSGFAEQSLPDYVRRLPPRSGDPILAPEPPLPLDALPVPGYDAYFEKLAAVGHGRLIRAEIPFETSRGCWWGERSACTFCADNATGLRYRQKSPARAYEEIVALSRYGDAFMAVDTIVPQNYFRELFPRLAASGVRFRCTFQLRASLTPEQLATLAALRTKLLIPGIESLSTPVLDTMRKGVTAVQNVAFLRCAEELGLRLDWRLVYGFPGEDASQYAPMAALLPRLSHLPAPRCARQVILKRHSPLHDEAEHFGLADIALPEAYALAHGDHAGLADQALFFDYRYARFSSHVNLDQLDPDTYARPLVAGAERWLALRQAPLAPRCELVRVRGRHEVLDTRDLYRVGRARPRLRPLSAPELDLLLMLQRPRSDDHLRRTWRHDVDLLGLLRDLEAQGWVIRLDELWVRLVVIRHPASFAGECRRVLAAKVESLGGELRQRASELLRALP